MTTLVADQQILRGATATLSWQYLDQDGENADPATVTVGVNRADGTVLVASGTATGGTGNAARTLALTAVQTAQLDTLAVTWTRSADSTTYPTVVEVVGAYYFTIAQVRARETSLANTQKYLAADLQQLRRDVETEFEEITEVAFVPRYRRERLSGTGASCLLLPTPFPRRVIAVSEVANDGATTAWTATEVAAIRTAEVTGLVHSALRSFPAGTQNLIVAWEHGHDRPPTDVRDKAMLRLRHHVTRPKSAVPDRAATFQLEGGNVYRLDQAGARKTGIADIDAVLDRYSMAIPGVA